MNVKRLSFVLRLVLLTSCILTVIFLCTGYLLSTSISAGATRTVEQEVVASFRAYESLWREHTQHLQKVSSVISRMADVRAAFQTNDQATIRDTAGELWTHIASGNALFTVTDGTGKVIAALGRDLPFRPEETLPFVPASSSSFPSQRTGFLEKDGRLFQIVVTPVYVDAEVGRELLTVLVTGFELDSEFLRSLKMASGGSDLIFELGARPLASTMADKSQMQSLGPLCSLNTDTAPHRLRFGTVEYMALSEPLPAMAGDSGTLCIVRSLAGSQQALKQLQQRTIGLWLAGLIAAIAGTYYIVRRMLRPVGILDRAAAEIAKGNYHVRVDTHRDDELGRLAASFNGMCASIEQARAELIRHERLESVARLATFVVHDLRNPLASIYAGAEMLVDHDLPDKQVKRLARNMYSASRGMLEILGELLSAARRQQPELEVCLLHDLIATAWAGLAEARRHAHVQLTLDIPADLELTLDRGAMERVFHNLLENAIEAIGDDGTVTIRAEVRDEAVLLHIRDTGRGIHPELRPMLFQPFATKGRVGGLGLGLALSRQTALAHGGDLWADFDVTSGSHFVLRLPFHPVAERAVKVRA